MASMEGSDATKGPTRKRTGRFASVRTNFMAKTGFGKSKAPRHTSASTRHLSEEPPARVPLTDADIARIEAICAEPPAVTDPMRTVIAAYRKLVRA